jgi:S1-C subfamily serine protease
VSDFPTDPMSTERTEPYDWGGFAASTPVGPSPDEAPSAAGPSRTVVAYEATAPGGAPPKPGHAGRRHRRRGWRAALVGGVAGALVGALVAGGIVALTDGNDGSSAGTGAAPVVVRPSDRIGRSSDIAPILQAAVPAVVAIVDDGGPDSGGAAGTGFVISPDGVIVTNNHVVSGARDIQAVFSDGTTRDATVLGRNAPSDLAVLKVSANDLPTIALGDSDRVQVGDDVVAIGNALALQGGLTVTRGIVSGLHREVGTNTGSVLEDVLQTDAAINPGNSGGPLVDVQGRVIGINTAIADPVSAQNVGFAIPISDAKAIIDQLRKGRQPALLGVRTVDVDQARVEGNTVAVDHGAFVRAVTAGSPAARAGIAKGDVVVAVDGQPIDSAAALGGAIRQHKPGDEVTIELDRQGKSVTVEATLTEAPTS